MAFDNYLQERIELILNEKRIPFVAKKMMGGLCFMVDDKMCIGIIKNDLMAMVWADSDEELRNFQTPSQNAGGIRLGYDAVPGHARDQHPGDPNCSQVSRSLWLRV